MKTKTQILHYPNLKTVLMVEKTLENANLAMNREELKAALPTKVMHQTLNVILDYLEESGKIMDGQKGILWIENKSPKMAAAWESGKEL